MSVNRTSAIISLGAVVLAVAAAGYLTRGYWTRVVPGGGAGLGKGAAYTELLGKGGDTKICYVCPMHKQIVREKPGDCPRQTQTSLPV